MAPSADLLQIVEGILAYDSSGKWEI